MSQISIHPKSKLQSIALLFVSKKIDKSPRKVSSRRDISAPFTGNPSQSTSMIKPFESLRNQVHETASSFSGVSRACKLNMCPVEGYIKSKKDDLKLKTEDVMENKCEFKKHH